MHTYFQTLAHGARKRERTRSCLIDSAVDVFSDKGLGNAKISDITELAGLANGTFYNHFKDKEELALETAMAIAVEVARQLDDAMADIEDAVTRVVVASTRFLEIAVNNRQWGIVLVDCFHLVPGLRTEVVQYLRADIERGVKQREFRVTLDEFQLDQVGALLTAALRRQLKTGAAPTLTDRVCENVLRVLGLTPTRAQQAVVKARPATQAMATAMQPT